jgi:hypothetical protein
MDSFASWLVSFIPNVLTWVYNIFIDLLQSVSDTAADFMISFVGLLPNSDPVPVLAPPTGDLYNQFVIGMNWLLPMQYFYDVLSWGFAMMLAYLSVAPFVRWLL